MNKQEAMDVIESISFYEKVNGNPLEDLVNEIYDDLKPVVPKFVAEWIEEAKAEEYSLYGALEMAGEANEDWIFGNDKTNQETFARAWLAYPNIEVEQEKLYTVEIPNPNGDSNRYGVCKVDGKIIIGSFVFGLDRASNAKLTESEIKQDFDFLWQFAKEVE